MSLLSTAELQQELASIGAALRQITASVSTRGRHGSGPAGQGSGIVWDADGTIVTNAHVATAEAMTVALADGAPADATLVARDPGRDLAILRADPSSLGAPLVPATPGSPDSLRPGELVVALGHPLGVPHAMALGVVHTIGPASWQQGRTIGSPSLIKTDIRLAPGNSGGPLADVRGRVLGVNAMIAGGLGVAVSIDEVRRLLARDLPRPRLGATLRPVAVRRAAEGSAIGVGLLVLEIARGGAAERAGLLPGDVLLGHAGRPFGGADDVVALLHDAGPGATLRLDVGRAGKRRSVVVELGPTVDPRRRAA
jgi:serine protease Do